jgi:hypothetical protein
MADQRGPRGHAEPLGRPLTGWVRFARCEVRDGVLRPARGARPEPYDPWEDYRAARSGWGGRGGPAPYESLLELVWAVRLLPGLPGEPPRLEPASEVIVTAWCAANGLLGILSHETEVAYLAPRWTAQPDFRAVGIPLVPVRRSYVWGPWGWQPAEDVWWRTHTPALEKAPKQEGALVPRAHQSELWGPPSSIGRLLEEGTVVQAPLGATWGRYFPDVPAREKESHAYPAPLSDEFWAAYGEPVEAFLAAAALFAQTLQGLDRGLREGEDTLTFVRRHASADRAFFNLTAGVQPSFDLTEDGGYARAWRAKSLLAAYAMMAYLDLTAGRRILTCEVCGKPFVSAAYQARYCSARCRKRR